MHNPILSYDTIEKITYFTDQKGSLRICFHCTYPPVPAMKSNPYELYHETKKHTPEDFPYNTYLCSIPLDFRMVSLHWHDEIEIIVIQKGNGLISVDLNTYEVHAGDIIPVFSGQLHSILQKGHESMEYENILLKASLLKNSGYDMCYEKFLMPLFSGDLHLYPVINKTFKYYERIAAFIKEIDLMCDRRPFAYQLAVKGYLYQIFYTLISHCESNRPDTSSKKSLEKVKAILTYIADNYQHEISIEEISGYCHYSKSYFMKFFKEIMGTSFIRYLNDYRLEAAARLLTGSADTVVTIAVACGFENLSYFNRSFKKKFGVTPGQYRKKIRQASS